MSAKCTPTETISTTINTDTGATTTITSGGVTKDNTLGLSGTVSDAGGVSSVQIYDGATLLGAATVSSGNWSYTTPALLDGSHSFTAKATDNAGNTTTTSVVTATINTGTGDTTPPAETSVRVSGRLPRVRPLPFFAERRPLGVPPPVFFETWLRSAAPVRRNTASASTARPRRARRRPPGGRLAQALAAAARPRPR